MFLHLILTNIKSYINCLILQKRILRFKEMSLWMITQPVSNRTEPKIQVFRCELQSFSWPRVVWPNTCLVPLALEFLGLNYCNHAVWNRIRSLSLYWTFSKSDKTQKLCSEGNLGSTYGYSFQVRCL